MPKKYSEEQKDTALILAAGKGIRPAARDLGMNEATIRSWIRDEPARWAEIKTEEAPKWRARAAAATEQIVDTLAELEAKAVAKLEADLDRLEPKEAANALKAITVSKGINADHVAKYRGQTAQTVEHNINFPQLDTAIAKLLSRPDDIDGQAIEIEPGKD